MRTPQSGSVARARIGILQSIMLLVVAVLPWPACWERLRGAVDSARSPELNRAEREGHAAGYYEGLIGGNDASRNDSAQKLSKATPPLNPYESEAILPKWFRLQPG